MKQYIKQNHPACNDDLRRVGCFWRTGMHIGELLSGQPFKSPETLNLLWQDSLELGLMKDTPTGPILHRGVLPIVKLALEYFDCSRQIAEIGTFKRGKTSYYGWYKAMGEDVQGGERFYVQKIKLDNSHVEPFHYRLVDNKGDVVFDPYEPSLPAEEIVYSIILEEIL